MTGIEKEVQQDQTSEVSDTDSNTSKTTANKTSVWKGDPMKDHAWHTTDIDIHDPGELEKKIMAHAYHNGQRL